MQLIEIDRPEHRSASSKPMVCATETYGSWPPNIGGWGSQETKRLTFNDLKKLQITPDFAKKYFEVQNF